MSNYLVPYSIHQWYLQFPLPTSVLRIPSRELGKWTAFILEPKNTTLVCKEFVSECTHIYWLLFWSINADQSMLVFLSFIELTDVY